MEVMRTNIGKLEVMAMEMLDLDQSRLIITQVHSHREQLAACQRQFRLANVKAMAALEAQSSRDLFKSSTDASKSGLRNRKDKEQMVAEHGSITNNLKAISRQLAETVEKSKQTVSNLEETSRTVEEVGEEHRLMGGVIGQSRKLITKYGRREFTDKVYCLVALQILTLILNVGVNRIRSGLFLCCCSVYIKEEAIPNIWAIGSKNNNSLSLLK